MLKAVEPSGVTPRVFFVDPDPQVLEGGALLLGVPAGRVLGIHVLFIRIGLVDTLIGFRRGAFQPQLRDIDTVEDLENVLDAGESGSALSELVRRFIVETGA